MEIDYPGYSSPEDPETDMRISRLSWILPTLNTRIHWNGQALYEVTWVGDWGVIPLDWDSERGLQTHKGSLAQGFRFSSARHKQALPTIHKWGSGVAKGSWLSTLDPRSSLWSTYLSEWILWLLNGPVASLPLQLQTSWLRILTNWIWGNL